MLRCVLSGMALCLALSGSADAGSAVCAAALQKPGLPLFAPIVRVQGEACTEACRRAHSACLIAEKGSPHCSIRLQRCLQACLARKRK